MAITMGNDEFILYIRKRHPHCVTSNDQLGKSIWAWIRAADTAATKVAEGVPCYWGGTGSFVAEDRSEDQTLHS